MSTSLQRIVGADSLPWWSPSQALASHHMLSVQCERVCMCVLLCLAFMIAVHLANEVTFSRYHCWHHRSQYFCHASQTMSSLEIVYIYRLRMQLIVVHNPQSCDNEPLIILLICCAFLVIISPVGLLPCNLLLTYWLTYSLTCWPIYLFTFLCWLTFGYRCVVMCGKPHNKIALSTPCMCTCLIVSYMEHGRCT